MCTNLPLTYAYPVYLFLRIKKNRNISWMYECKSRHGIIRYIDTKAKWRHLIKLTCKGTLRQVFIRVYRLEIQSVMFVFSTQLCELWPPTPFPVWISILYTRIQCVRGGRYGVLGFRQINTCRKVLLQVNFFRWRHYALPSMSLIFPRVQGSVEY